jgi:hypothetical protein
MRLPGTIRKRNMKGSTGGYTSSESARAAALPAGALPELPELVGWMARRVKALELGSGGGVDALWLAEQGYLATVVEPSPERARQLRLLASARALPLQVVRWHLKSARLPGSYDIVVARARGPLLSPSDVEMLVRRMQESTRRGGYNVLALELDAAESTGSADGECVLETLLGIYDGWRMLGRRRYRPEDGLGNRIEVVRLIAQRRG